MKIRSSFVSNSSSSSFCLAGVLFKPEKFDFSQEWFEEMDFFEQAIKDGNFDRLVYGEMAHRLPKSLVMRNTEDEGELDDVYVGIPIDEMLPDETRNQFLKRAYEALKLIGYNGDEKGVDMCVGCARH